MALVDGQIYPNLANLVGEVLGLWPQHKRYLDNSLGARDQNLLSFSERLSAMVGRLAVTIDGGIRALANDYRFLCEEISLPEEIHFRRAKKFPRRGNDNHLQA